MALRFKIQLTQRLLVVFAMVAFVNACGPGKSANLPRTSQEFADMGVAATDPKTTTGVTAPDGKNYTSYSPTAEVQEVKKTVSDSDENKKFGAQIEKASIIYKTSTAPNTNPLITPINKVDVHVKWQGLEKDLTFEGQLNSSGKAFIAQMNETSNQRADLSMAAICSDVDCYHGEFKLSDTQGHSVAIIINKQTRTLRLKVPADPQVAGYSSNPYADQFKLGKPVVVTTTEIYPGKSYYEIEEVTANKETPGLKLSGDLEEPSGDAVPVQVSDASQNSKVSLIGNDEQGSLLFKFSPLDDGSVTSVDDPPATPSDSSLPNEPSKMPKPATPQPAQQSAEAPSRSSNGSAAKQTAPQPQAAPAAVTPSKHRTPAIYLELDDDEPEANMPQVYTPTPARAPVPAPAPVVAPRQQQPNTHQKSQTQAPSSRAVAPTTNSGSNNPTSPYPTNSCPIKVPDNASAMIQQIMKDCGNSEVDKYIYGSWTKAGGRPRGWHAGDPEPRLAQMQRFLYINELRQQANPKPDARDKRPNETMTRVEQMRTVVNILDAEKFPEIWTLITLQESNLNNMAVGADGEFGLWQFMTATATTYGLLHIPQVSKENDQRRNVALETKAAVRYYRDLLDTWNGDIKMALASYNRGGPGMQAAARSLEKKVNQGKIEIPEFAEAYAISHDFWYIYKHRMIVQRRGQWGYVPSILAAMMTAVAPQAYGIDSSQAMDLK